MMQAASWLNDLLHLLWMLQNDGIKEGTTDTEISGDRSSSGREVTLFLHTFREAIQLMS